MAVKKSAGKRIRLLICSTLIPPAAGGAEQVAWATAVETAKDPRFDVHVLTTGRIGTYSRDNVTVHSLKNLWGKEGYYTTIARADIRRIQELGFDIMHFHIGLPWSFVFRNADCVKIMTAHGAERIRSYLDIRKWLLILAMRKMDIITVPGISYQKDIERLYDKKPVLIPNGIDASYWRPLPGITQHGRRVLFVGRFIERKGIRDLLKASELLPDVQFVFVGTGPLENIIRGPNVRCIGPRYGKDLLMEYSKATVCAFPSKWENLPIVGLEAMACRRASVASEIGFSEIIRHGKDGLIIKSQPEDIADAIAYLLKNPKVRRKMETSARKRALEFDYRKISKHYIALYLKAYERRAK